MEAVENIENNAAARLFACDCAEHVLHIFETKCPGEDRPRRSIEMTRRFVRGDASKKEQEEAVRAADEVYIPGNYNVCYRKVLKAVSCATDEDPVLAVTWAYRSAYSAALVATVAEMKARGVKVAAYGVIGGDLPWRNGEDAQLAECEWQAERMKRYVAA